MNFKRIAKSLLIPVIIIFFLEIIFLSIFYIIDENDKLSLYKDKRVGNLNYRYFSEVKLVLPLPDVETVTYQKEFTDRFITNDALGKGFGLFDDGVNTERSYFSVAIGDSITKGVGSINNIANGWVELVEKELKSLDIVNLGGLGLAVNDQKYNYNLLKKFITHDIVIYNFAGGDYFENGLDSSAAFYINNLIQNEKINKDGIQKIINDLQIYHGYNPALEYLYGTSLKSYTIWFAIKFIQVTRFDKIIPKFILPDIFKLDSQHYDNYKATRMNLVSDEIFELANQARLSLKSFKNKNKVFFVAEKYKEKEIVDKLVDNASEQIKIFYNELKNENKQFLFIFHPSKNDAYYPFIKDNIPQNLNIDYGYLRKRLLKNLDMQFPILDLTPFVQGQIFEQKQEIYWDYDNHYNVNGYKLVSKEIAKFISLNLEN